MPADKVFISYVHESEPEMLKLVDQLANRFPIWKDSEIQPADDVIQRLRAEINESYCCILLLTEHTEKSAWCMQEVGAFLGAGKPVITYRLNPGIASPALLAGTKVAENVDQLARALTRAQTTIQPDIPAALPFVREVFPYSAHWHLKKLLYELAGKARDIRLMGTGLQILGDALFCDRILGRAAKGQCNLQIYLADPYSPAVEQRLIEENVGDNPVRDKLPVEKGQFGIRERAEHLANRWAHYPDPKPKLPLKLFTHGPTFALLNFGDDYFFYPYGCDILGDYSPVFHVRSLPEHREALDFFESHYARVDQTSTAYSRLVNHGKLRMNLNTEELYGFAVYVIPEEASDLYDFGAEILGYDVINPNRPSSTSALAGKLHRYVGGARQFGFHLTVCDALFFLTEGEIKSAIEQVRFVASQYNPFKLVGLKLQKGLPDLSSIALEPSDPSGKLELLHHEFVHRINRRATASYYTLGSVPKRDDDPERSDLMIKRYLAPYILSRFRPHFTMLAEVPSDKQAEIVEVLAEGLDNKNLARPIVVEVSKLAIMMYGKRREDTENGEFPRVGPNWEVREWVPLGDTSETKAIGSGG